MAEGILDEAGTTLDRRETTERPLAVFALELRATVVDASLALVDVWVKKSRQRLTRRRKNLKGTNVTLGLTAPLTFAVVVVGEFVAGAAADLSLAAEGALRVDAALAHATVDGAHQTLVDI